MYRSVITNTSKEMSSFSDFPCPEDFPNFLPHGLLLEYFRMYARHFQLLQHIRFKVGWGLLQGGHEGLQVPPSPGWDGTTAPQGLHVLCTLNTAFLAPCFKLGCSSRGCPIPCHLQREGAGLL